MKNKRILLTILGFVFVNYIMADKPAWPGIWAMWGGSGITKVDKPWYKGCMGTTVWKTIEPQPGEFDFTEMDKFIYEAAGNNLYIGYMVYVGSSCPQWIYSAGVPKVTVDNLIYPYYLDEDFKYLLKNMINEVVEHIQSYPTEIRAKIAFVQCPAGTSGDPQPWNGTPTDPQYIIDPKSKAWEDYNKEIFTAYANAYSVLDTPVSLLMKPNANNFNSLNSYIPNLFLKTYTVAQGYQTKDDLAWEWLRYAINKFDSSGRAVRARGEMTHIDLPTSDWYDEAPVWNIYTECLWSLTYGMDVLNLREKHITGSEAIENTKAFNFYSAYAGYKDARDSHGAWCALRDGLDYDDVNRFPESVYGEVGSGKNIPRYVNIANAFASKGAKMGETEFCWADGVTWTKYAKAMNDVCRSPWKDNYGMFMHQIDPNETSVGFWRVGSKNEPYGRFARGFENSTGKNTMYFDIDDTFFFDKPQQATYSIKVRVVYFDQGSGSWELRYDAINNSQKTGFTVVKTNSGQWKEIEVDLTDANFGNRLPHGSDVMLVNTDQEDDIFHMVEITRNTGDRKGYWGYAKQLTKVVDKPGSFENNLFFLSKSHF